MFKKIFVLGIDGMDYNLTQQYLGEGKLKNIEHILKKGTFLPLLSSNPSQSPVAWASMATGKDPGEHGIFDFIKIDRKKYIPLLSLFDLKASIFSFLPQFKRTIKAETVWENLSHRGLKVKVFRWPCTFPSQRINGESLTGMGTPDVKGGLGGYTFYTTRDINTKDKRGEIIKIEIKNNKIKSFVKGPKILKFKGKKEILIPFEIQVENGKTILALNNKEIVLKESEWTDWIEFNFKIKADIISRAIGKFFLISTHPEFQLYMTPLNISPLNEIFPISFPRDFSKKIYKKIGHYATLGLAEDTNALNDGIIDELPFLEMCEFLLKEKLRILFEEVKSDASFFSFVFDTLDRIQHMFWHYIDTEHPYRKISKNNEKCEKTIENYYKKFDNIIGKINSMIDKDSLLIIISDHGFGPLRKIIDLNAFLREEGFLKLRNGGVSPPLFKNFDFKRTSAYTCGFTGIYINKKGREGKGIVDEKQFPIIKDKLKKTLLNFTDKETGKKVVKKVYDATQIYSTKYLNKAPDLVLGFEKGYRTGDNSVIGGVEEKPIKDNLKKWSGDHIFDPQEVPGIFISSIPLDLQKVSVFDIKNIIEQNIII